VGALDERRSRDTLVGPVVRTSGRQLLVRLLPEKLAVGFTERHQHAAIPGLLGIAWSLVVRADEYHPTRNHGVAVALRAEFSDPFHVLLALEVPFDRQSLHVRNHIAVGSAAPHGPLAAAWIGRQHD